MRAFLALLDANDLKACVWLLAPEDIRAEFDVAFRGSAD